MSQIHIKSTIGGKPATALAGWQQTAQSFFFVAWVTEEEGEPEKGEPDCEARRLPDVPSVLQAAGWYGFALSEQQASELAALLEEHRSRNAGNEVVILGGVL